MFSEYRKAVPATLEAFGGKFIVRGGKLKLLEGEWPHSRLVIIEFPSREAAEGWYKSPAYQKIIGLRLSSTVGNLIIVEGQVDLPRYSKAAVEDPDKNAKAAGRLLRLSFPPAAGAQFSCDREID